VKQALQTWNHLLKEHQFDQGDRLLSELDPCKLSLETALAILTITYPARDFLDERQAFRKRLENELKKTRPEGAVQNLLKGL
jgi:hypothetical protein